MTPKKLPVPLYREHHDRVWNPKTTSPEKGLKISITPKWCVGNHNKNLDSPLTWSLCFQNEALPNFKTDPFLSLTPVPSRSPFLRYPPSWKKEMQEISGPSHFDPT